MALLNNKQQVHLSSISGAVAQSPDPKNKPKYANRMSYHLNNTAATLMTLKVKEDHCVYKTDWLSCWFYVFLFKNPNDLYFPITFKIFLLSKLIAQMQSKPVI